MGKTMKLREIVSTFILTKKNRSFNQLMTIWGEELNKEKVLTEYPRPQLVRDNYTILNGLWNYSIRKEKKRPKTFDGKILVPFSPESILSGVNRQVLPEDYLWYERNFIVNKILSKKRCILHFGAVDQMCKVYVNHRLVKKHIGGYLPFSCDITDSLRTGSNLLTVMVVDYSDTSYHSRGKQTLNRGGMFYTAQSGIWQTVWLEWVPDEYITSIKITPHTKTERIELEIHMNHWEKKAADREIHIEIYEGVKKLTSVKGQGNKFLIPVTEPVLWSPENPFLYDIIIKAGKDKIKSYFAMRSFEVKKDITGILRIFLNGKPYFQNGVLDQGYWPDGLYTAPSDEALIYDIVKMKELGFNMLRKHIKVEPLRWYYHCDRLGMIVWQDMVNGGEKYNMFFLGYLPILFPGFYNRIKDSWYYLFSRMNEKGRNGWIADCRRTVEHLYNCPSIAVWVPFNEGWGQFDAEAAVSLIHSLDKGRLIDQASGWFDQKGGDFRSIHNYFRKVRIVPEKRAVVLSEFAGYACYIKNHAFSEYIYGYQIYKDTYSLNRAVHRLFDVEIKRLMEKGLAAAVFTQLSDVEGEVNGLLTYDRKICKISPIEMINYNKTPEK
ncbi:glycoside hydrolase family 2 protein [Anaerocolumna cellulosilytica]|nr:sugar-binding domain-containing protein [Anaerocolumna cellulosilytica]MBB5195496.1 hypothetical protein [Anaerocolumna cellulosilytica]